ncbi:MAG: response regulator [Oscillospiraceae bacterium]|nr:response regulator [Oscillospiraceae bacterium]
MKIYLIDDDTNVLHILKMIIQAKNLGEICGLCHSPVDAQEDLKYIQPDIVIVDLLMPDMDGITFVRQAKAQFEDIAFIMLSQVSSKDMISAAYESGVEFFIQKPINAIEVESVLTKVSHSLSMRRTLNSMQNLLMTQMQALASKPAAPKAENIYIQKVTEILQRLGIAGEIGCKDIINVVDYMVTHRDEAADMTLLDLCAQSSDTPKSVEQRIRRTVNTAMVNLAHLGLEDYANDTFVEYSNTLFNFEQIRREMDHIRGKSLKGGNVKIRNFLSALVSYCCK